MPTTVRLLAPVTIAGDIGRGKGDIVTLDDTFAANLIASNQAEPAPVTSLAGAVVHTVDSLTNPANPDHGAPGIVDGATYLAATSSASGAENWVDTTNGQTLTIGGEYIMQAGHTVNLPAISNANNDQAIKIMPANNDWPTLGGNINLAGGDTFSGTGLIAGSNTVRLVADNTTKTWIIGL